MIPIYVSDDCAAWVSRIQASWIYSYLIHSTALIHVIGTVNYSSKICVNVIRLCRGGILRDKSFPLPLRQLTKLFIITPLRTYRICNTCVLFGKRRIPVVWALKCNIPVILNFIFILFCLWISYVGTECIRSVLQVDC